MLRTNQYALRTTHYGLNRQPPYKAKLPTPTNYFLGSNHMNFLDHPVKGINKNLLDADLDGEPLHMHISEVGPGSRAHPPHRHGGIEAFYMIEGEGTLEIDGESFLLKANESAVFDPQKLHGLTNYGDVPMKYMVIIYRDQANT